MRDWINSEATIRYGFPVDGEKYRQIMYFVDMLLTPKFEKIVEKEIKDGEV